VNKSSVEVVGTDPEDFPISGNTCGSSLAGGASWTVSLSSSQLPRERELLRWNSTTTAARVLYRDQYTGTWSGKNCGGHLFGKIIHDRC